MSGRGAAGRGRAAGRADPRGRGRGRAGRGRAPSGANAAPPGQAAESGQFASASAAAPQQQQPSGLSAAATPAQEPASAPPAGGRGRGRGMKPPATSAGRSQASAAPMAAPPTASGAAEATASMEAMSLSAQSEAGAAPAARASRPERGAVEVFKNEDFNTRAARMQGEGEVKAYGNAFKLMSEIDRNTLIYHYHIQFVPECENKRLRKALVNTALETWGCPYDGNTIFVPKPFDTSSFERTVQTKRGEEFELRVKFTDSFPMSSPTAMSVFNLMLKRAMGQIGLEEVNRRYFDPKKSRHIPELKLEVWPGFITAISKHGSGEILLNVDTISKVLRQENVYDVVGFRSRGRQDTTAIVKKIVGQIVLTRYNNKTYRVDDIDFKSTPRSTFERNGEEISYADYYHQQYNLQIQDPNQPMLVSRPKLKGVGKRERDPLVYLVPELCFLTGLDDESRSNFRTMKTLAEYTKVGPSLRAELTRDFVAKLYQNDKAREMLERWGLKFDREHVKVLARKLPGEKLVTRAHREGTQPRVQNIDANTGSFEKELRSAVAFKSGPIPSWLLLYTNRRDGEVNAQAFVRTLQQVSAPMGMDVASPRLVALSQDRDADIANAIEKNMDPSVGLVVVILSTNNTQRYNTVKRICCIKRPVPSQCVVNKTIGNQKRLMSICTKIAMQINCKLGGIPWALEFPPVGPLQDSMVIGIDTYHCAEQSSHSAVGYVASLDRGYTSYFSYTSIQAKGEEMMNCLEFATRSAFEKFNQLHKKYPKHLYIYRDGVGDGQLSTVKSYELPQIQRAASSLGVQGIKITFVVVQKRVNQRFFLPAGGSGRMNNVPPGTVVDSVMTRPEWYDFFLVSQTSTQGTVSPTHYNVIHDDIRLPPGRLQLLTHKLHHLYFNWSGTISVPAPCQYAHKLAFLVGQNLGTIPSLLLNEKLYFL